MSAPTATSAMDADGVRRLRATAREAFGWEELRPGQAEAMSQVLAGRDTLAVMPTGSGKSAVYQVPALLLDGPTVVVSPLVALQRDQVQQLLARQGDVGGAVALNSSRRAAERREAWEALGSGDLEFVLLAPEQLAKPEVLARLKAARPSVFVVDEAHCISSWGHDFRPDYLRLGAVVHELGHPVVLALTATASPPVRAEIVERLGMRDPVTIVHGFDRPNLHLAVERHADADGKRRAVVERAVTLPKPGIVYTATRRSAEELAAAVAEVGLEAGAYHAGLRKRDRDDVQARFTAGELDVVVATTAFGMGIDKADVRFVLHAEVPDSPDSYYQEVGRAGRDGDDAQAVLFWREEDLGLRRFFASGSPPQERLRRVAALLAAHDGPVDRADLAQEADESETRLATAVDLLARAGAVDVDASGTVLWTSEAASPAEAVAAAEEVAADHQRVEGSRVDMMRAFCETTGCRRQFLLAYFGETLPEPCGRCDTCDAGTARVSPDAAESPFPVGAAVEHTAWGAGQVMRYEGDRLVVLFEDVGYRTLALATVLERGLLHLRDAAA